MGIEEFLLTRAKNEGRELGIQKGRVELLVELIKEQLCKEQTPEQIAEMLEMPVDSVLSIYLDDMLGTNELMLQSAKKEGVQEGSAIGKRQKKEELIRAQLGKKNLSPEQIADFFGEPIEVVQLISRILGKLNERMVTRVWHGRTSLKDVDAYLTFLLSKGTEDYKKIKGNLSVKVWHRLEDECAHFYTVTEWDSIGSIKEFAGEDYEKAVYYPEDEGVLLEFEERVVHYQSYTI